MRSHAKAIVAISALLLTSVGGASTASAAVPVVSIAPTPTASYTSAHVTGTVDPADHATSFYFQYSKDPGTEGWSYGSYQELSAGAGPTVVSDDFDAAHSTALKPGTKYFTRIYAYNESGEAFSAEPSPSFTTEAVGPPTVSIDPVTTFNGTTAHFSANIDPNAPGGNPDAFKVDYHFECVPACPGLKANQTLAAGPDNEPVFDDASGLDPNTDYEVKLVASNAAGPVTAGPQSFKTTRTAPLVETLYAGSVGLAQASLAAEVNPRNSPATYQLEWGTDTSYGNLAPAAPQVLGSEDNSFHLVTAPISGLAQGTTYHFRIRATNTATSELATGADHTFTTLEAAGPPAPSCPNEAFRVGPSANLRDCRAYEIVSPPLEKGGDVEADRIDDYVTSGVSVAGDRVAYSSTAQFRGIPMQTGSIYNQYLSRRTASGWLTRGILPPKASLSVHAVLPLVIAFSADLSQTIVMTNAELDGPSNVSTGPYSLYLQNNATDTSTYDLLSRAALPVSAEPASAVELFDFADATPDFSSAVFSALHLPLLPDVPENIDALYRWSPSGLDLVSRLPGSPGAPVQSAPGARRPSISNYNPGENVISDDGRRVYFTANAALYVRDGFDTTRLVSGSERVGDDPSVPVSNSTFLGAEAATGATAFFSSSAKLTDDATADVDSGTQDLYRWDANAPQGSALTDLTTVDPGGGRVLGLAAMDDSAQHLYFVAGGDLAPGAERGEPNLYLWQAGHGVSLIATLDGTPGDFGLNDEAVWTISRWRASNDDKPVYRDTRLSADGTRLLFASHARLTSYDNDGHKQLYLYDAETSEMTCVSCNPRASKSTADAEIFGVDAALDDTSRNSPWSLPRNLSPDGESVVFESREGLVPGDANGRSDVYRWHDGRLELISTGQSGEDAKLIGVSASGDDVFFATREQLVSSDVDNLIDVYDARVGGGLPQPASPVACEGEACQSPPSPPNDVTPSSSTFRGAGNLNETPAKARCGKGKARQRGRCVRKKSKKHRANAKQQANANRGGIR